MEKKEPDTSARNADDDIYQILQTASGPLSAFDVYTALHAKYTQNWVRITLQKLLVTGRAIRIPNYDSGIRYAIAPTKEVSP